MDYKEAMKTLGLIERDMRELHSQYPHDYNFAHASGYFDKLKSFIKTQQETISGRNDEINPVFNRLSELEEDCPDCGGYGYQEQLVDHCDMDGEHLGTESAQVDCPNPSYVNGKAVVCYLPEGVVKFLYDNNTYFGMEHNNIFKIKILDDKHPDDRDDDLKTVYEFTKQPNNLWKLESRSRK